MKKNLLSQSACSHPRVRTALPILLLSASLLAPGGSSTATAQGNPDQRLPLPDAVVLQEQKVFSGDGTSDDYFGRTVAVNGSTALIGAYADNGFHGAAYIFTESNGIWSEGQKLTASDGVPGDEFGMSLALGDDTLVIAAPSAKVNGATEQGAVYVFHRVGDTWVESQKLIASDGAANDFFGGAVALSGRTLVVGASDAMVNGQFHEGAAYVFGEANGMWRQVQKLAGSDSGFGDNFGVAVAAQGSTILVSAPFKNVDSAHFITGEVYVFSRSGFGWTQTQSLIAEDSGTFANFGMSLALDSFHALIGAPHATANGHAAQGAAYLFAVSGGTLTETQELVSRDGVSLDGFGQQVAIAGNRALVSAPTAQVGSNPGQGKVYLFGETDDGWRRTATIVASDGSSRGNFGFDVALGRDTALIGNAPTTFPHIDAAYFYMAPADNLP